MYWLLLRKLFSGEIHKINFECLKHNVGKIWLWFLFSILYICVLIRRWNTYKPWQHCFIIVHTSKVLFVIQLCAHLFCYGYLFRWRVIIYNKAYIYLQHCLFLNTFHFLVINHFGILVSMDFINLQSQ